MLSKPCCGWTTFEFGGHHCPASYLEDYPFTLGYAFLAAAGRLPEAELVSANAEWGIAKGVVIDQEGNIETLKFSFDPDGAVIARIWSGYGELREGDEVLYEAKLDKERLERLMNELADDIEMHLDEWTREWSLFCEPELEPDAEEQFSARRRELLGLVSRMR